MTECSQTQFTFQAHFSRQVTGQFDSGTMTSDAGGLLLLETDRRMNLLPRLAQCFLDRRAPARIQHSVAEMISQRVAAFALGYEDLNDHEQLRQDPVLKLLAARRTRSSRWPARARSTRCSSAPLSRPLQEDHLFETGHRRVARRHVLEAHTASPEEIVLDIDTTDVPCTAIRKAASFTATTITTVTCPCTFSRRAPVVRAPALRQHRRFGRKPGRNPAHRRTDSPALGRCASRSAATPVFAATS